MKRVRFHRRGMEFGIPSVRKTFSVVRVDIPQIGDYSDPFYEGEAVTQVWPPKEATLEVKLANLNKGGNKGPTQERIASLCRFYGQFLEEKDIDEDGSDHPEPFDEDGLIDSVCPVTEPKYNPQGGASILGALARFHGLGKLGKAGFGKVKPDSAERIADNSQ